MSSLATKIADRLRRINDGRRKLQWLLLHRDIPDTCPIFIFGAQRSGTGMLGECLGSSPVCENLGETDSRAFENYTLRDLQIIDRLIASCRYPFLVFKPLKDSHRVRDVLALRSTARGIWAYRNYVDRVNSAVRQFGRRPLEVFSAYQRGDLTRWQLQGMSGDTSKLLADVDLGELTESDGAALMWWVRNSLYFDQALDRDARVCLWSYDRFVQDSEKELHALLEHLGVAYDPAMLGRVHSRSVGKSPLPQINRRILELCASLHERLETHHRSLDRNATMSSISRSL